MSERTGLGAVEIALLEAAGTSRFLRCDKALAGVEERIGLAPGYAYEVLVDLARPWTMPVSLVHTYRDGLRPPFRPDAIIEAVREVIRRPDVTSRELAGIAARPHFLTGCAVSGDLTALAAGRPVELRLQAHVSISDDGRQVVIENIPPNVSTDETARVIASRASARPWAHDHPGLHHITFLPLADLKDETSDRTSPFGRLICTPRPGTSPEQLRDKLLEIPGVYTTMPVKLPRPLPLLIRQWVQANAHEDLLASLTALEQAISGQRP